MYVRIGRLVAAVNRLKSFVEDTGAEFGGASTFTVKHCNPPAGEVTGVSLAVWDDTALPPNTGRDFDYLAFDSETQAVIGFGSRAIFALQYADEAAPQSEITILHAGALGRSLWERQSPLDVARPLISARSDRFPHRPA